ncbi:MAG: nucleoside recognition domain-containing protein [Desulfuromonadales bacterium]
MNAPATRNLVGLFGDCLNQAVRTSYVLFRIIVPIAIGVRLLELTGAIELLGQLLAPVMALVGLPGSMGLVWATTLVTNLYGGMVVFAGVAPGAGLTVAQVTVLATMMLIAHAIPVEASIARQAGTRFRAMAALRIAGALAAGALLNLCYLGSGTLQQPNQALWNPPPRDPSWLGWAGGEALNLVYIFLIILSLLILMRLLERLGIIKGLTRLLQPVLTLLGVSDRAAPLAIIGMTLGLTYGGGLIIQEARAGHLSRHDVFCVLALLGLCHSFIEDTLLMVVIGGHLSGTLVWRTAFALIVTFLIARLLRRLPAPLLDRWFFGRQP